MDDLTPDIKQTFMDIGLFIDKLSPIRLRSYQREAAYAIAKSVIQKQGLSFVIMFPRQSGKNELQAQVETYLLLLLHKLDAEFVKLSPTWKPQSLNAMRRLERNLKKNFITRSRWTKETGYIFRVGSARIYFLSASPTANVVGATASWLLECDEAQDVLIDKWDKEIAPMAASTNATRVFWGTAWTSQTLLARERRAALEAEKIDGIKRVFEITANQVREEVPAYGKFVDSEIAKHGRNHPFIRTQYFSEEIDEQTGMFTAERLALMQGTHQPALSPEPGHSYAFCIDVGGEDFSDHSPLPMGEGRGEGSMTDGHDSTTLTIFDIAQPARDLLGFGPSFHAVYRKAWTGAAHVKVFQQVQAFAELWNPYRIVVDATGVGEGLTSFLMRAYPSAVIPFKFTQASKSELGWKLISLIESGRYKEYSFPLGETLVGAQGLRPGLAQGLRPGLAQSAHQEEFDSNLAALQELFFEQCKRTTFELMPGPGKLTRWSVPEGARSFNSGEPLHDDLLLSAALVAALSDEPWGTAESVVIKGYNPILEMAFRLENQCHCEERSDEAISVKSLCAVYLV